MKNNWIDKNVGTLSFALLFLFGTSWIVIDNDGVLFQLAMLSGILFFFVAFIAFSNQNNLKHINISNIEGGKSSNDRKIRLNKNPNDLKKVLAILLEPKDKVQDQQINVFINNVFEWDSKYGTIPNYDRSLTYLNKKKVKLLSGFMFYMLNNKKITSHQSQPKKKFLESVMIAELKHLNIPNIGLSEDGLRKQLGKNLEYFKQQFFSSSAMAEFKLFQ